MSIKEEHMNLLAAVERCHDCVHRMEDAVNGIEWPNIDVTYLQSQTAHLNKAVAAVLERAMALKQLQRLERENSEVNVR